MANEYYFPWYPAHYRRDAGHLDHVSDSCYRRLIDAYMEGGEPIKKDPVRLMAIMRVSAEQFALVWSQIEGFFVLSPDGYLHHKRCNVELDRQDLTVKNKSVAGQRSAQKRKIQSEQYQLLVNSRSTAVQHLLEHSSTGVPPMERKGIKDTPNGDAGASPSASPSPRQMLFTACLTWLAELNGKDPSKYRGTMGQWLRDHGEIRVLQSFVDAQKQNPQGDRVAYMQRILTPKPRKVPQI